MTRVNRTWPSRVVGALVLAVTNIAGGTVVLDRPPPRAGHMAAVVGDGLYVAGGSTDAAGSEARLDVIKPAVGSWTPLPTMPKSRALGCMVAVDSRLYLLGGISRDGKAVPDIDIFDIERGAWLDPIRCDPLPSRSAAVVIDKEIYIVGGIIAKTESVDGVHSGRVDSFNTTSGQWTRRADLQHGRHGHAAFAVDGEIHVTGGYVAGGEHSEQTRSVEIYDHVANRWRDGLPTQRVHAFHGMAIVNGLVHVFGSRGEDCTPEVFDRTTKRWIDAPAMPLPRNRFACGVIDNRLYVIDGEDTNGRTPPTMMIFNGRDNTWTMLPESTVSK